MGKEQKMEKHLAELEELTSGNSKDAVTFAGRGLELLKSLIGGKSLSKKVDDAADTEEIDEDEEDPAETGEKQGKAKTAMEKSVHNGGDLEDADEDPEDPADTGEDAEGGSIITNKGKKIPKNGSPAIKKSYTFDEKHFEKSFVETYEDAIDASEALADLAKSVTVIGNAHNENAALLKSVMKQNVVLAQAVGELLKSQASIAAELEAIKGQPVNAPAPGFLMMSKKADSAGASTSLRKSDIQDTLTDLMNSGYEGANQLLKKLGVIHNQVDLKDFVDNLPEDIQEKL